MNEWTKTCTKFNTKKWFWILINFEFKFKKIVWNAIRTQIIIILRIN
jgi:hypothetical protein